MILTLPSGAPPIARSRPRRRKAAPDGAGEKALARDLGGEEALRQIGELILGIKPRAFRHCSGEISRESAAPSPVSLEIMNTRSKSAQLAPSCCASGSSASRSTRSILLSASTAAARARPSRRGCARVVVDAARRIDQHDDHIGIGGAGPCGRDHRAIEPARGAKIPGVSTKMSCASPLSAMPSTRLRVVCTFGVTIDELGADEQIEQRRFARIGRADQRDIAAALSHEIGDYQTTTTLLITHRSGHDDLISIRYAPAPPPRPRSRRRVSTSRSRSRASSPSTFTVTVKRRLCAGPSVATV